MGYGGLRGAVGFSLAVVLHNDVWYKVNNVMVHIYKVWYKFNSIMVQSLRHNGTHLQGLVRGQQRHGSNLQGLIQDHGINLQCLVQGKHFHSTQYKINNVLVQIYKVWYKVKKVLVLILIHWPKFSFAYLSILPSLHLCVGAVCIICSPSHGLLFCILSIQLFTYYLCSLCISLRIHQCSQILLQELFVSAALAMVFFTVFLQVN